MAHVFGRFIDAVNGDRFLDSFWIIRENHSDDALKDNESHTAAIFFIVLVFLAVISDDLVLVLQKRTAERDYFGWNTRIFIEREEPIPKCTLAVCIVVVRR